MRRLQANLAYLAAIADRSHKPSSNIPPHPAIISAPNLSPRKSAPTASSTIEPETNGTDGGAKTEEGEADEADRAQVIRGLYARLQSLFPGVDPSKEPPLTSNPSAAATAAAAQMMKAQQAKNAAAAVGPGQRPMGGAPPGGVPPGGMSMAMPLGMAGSAQQPMPAAQ